MTANRSVLWVIAVALVCGLVSCAGREASPATPTTPAAAKAARPNIVVIIADDMGFSDLGCYGSEIPTPNIDALARGGARFSQFYNTARCSPTRASLLTGLYPHQADMGHLANSGDARDQLGYRNELSRDAVTIGEVLKPAGYETYMVGKWHLTRNVTPAGPKQNWPRQRGFDHFYGTILGGGNYFDPAMLTKDNDPISAMADPDYKPAEFYYTDAIADHAAGYIKSNVTLANKPPMFLYVAFTSPHWPLHAPEDAIAKHKGKYDAGFEPIRKARFERQKASGLIDPDTDLSPAAQDWNDVRNKQWNARCMEVYAAQIERMDAGVGKIVAALKEAGTLDNTLILLMADNGGCAEEVGRGRPQEADRNTATTRPRAADLVLTNGHPRWTRDGRSVRVGPGVMPGAQDTFIAYGRGWANVSNTPFREYKHWTHEGGISSPLIAHWPKGIAPRSDWERQPTHLVDVMPTVVELAGATYPKTFADHTITPMSGVSLLPAFASKSLNRPTPIFFDHESNRAVRDGKWKLVSRGAKGQWELYDIEADRSEQHNLASHHPDRVKAMGDQWQRWAETTNVLPRPANPPGVQDD